MTVFVTRHDGRRYQDNLFFFNATATTKIYTLSLHDALPISCRQPTGGAPPAPPSTGLRDQRPAPVTRSEEHTSELQSHSDLVCRLLLEKKKRRIEHHQNSKRIP